MTSNVYDLRSATIASDSRWSIEMPGKCLIYVDDSGYEKVDVVGEHAFLFAGDVNLIHQWKIHLRLRSQGDPAGRPKLEGIAFLAVKLGTCEVIGGYGQDISPQEDGQIVASFAGTGSFHAHQCWRQNKCAKTAIASAVKQDYFSGLPVKYLNLVDIADKDCDSALDLEVLRTALLEKGMVMKPVSVPGTPVPLKVAAQNDPEIKAYMDGVASGTVKLQAPCDAMFNKPSEEDERQVDQVLEKIFGK